MRLPLSITVLLSTKAYYEEALTFQDGGYNASNNIGLKLLLLLKSKPPYGLGDGHLALEARTLNGNSDYTSYSTPEADRESIDKPTTLAVGR